MSAEEPKWVIDLFAAHGILGCLAWAVIFPIGATLIRVIPSKKAWIIHAGVMLFGMLAFTTTWSIGYVRVVAHGVSLGYSAHFIIGTILFALAWLQPFFGLAHHYIWVATGKRTLISAAHIFFGRLFMLIGVVNGGVGLLLAGNSSRTEQIVYGTLVGVIWVTYILSSLGMEVDREAKKVEAAARQVSESESESHKSHESTRVDNSFRKV